MTDPIFDTTMEQRLQGAMLEYLDGQRVFMLQWQQAQDVLIMMNGVAILGLAGVTFMLAMRVHKMEESREQSS